jgi:glycolate oxidase iron-sulfur subunit
LQTTFTLAQLADPPTARSEQILRKCVHCGFCTATCPTFVLLGDERDSPRGRIYLIKAMLEGNRSPTEPEVRHIDRCLSCLSCMTTCPSGVNYMHLVDHGRHHIEQTYQRSLPDRLVRRLLGLLMPRPRLFRWAVMLGWLAKPLAALIPSTSRDPGGATFLRRLKAMIEAIPSVGHALAGRSAADLSGVGRAASAWR